MKKIFKICRILNGGNVASITYGKVEELLATELLYNLGSPLGVLLCELGMASTMDGRLFIIKKFIEKHLDQKVDLQDERISALFDTAMKNMARKVVETAVFQRQMLEGVADTMVRVHCLTQQLESSRPKTLSDYVQKGLAAVSSALSSKKEENLTDEVVLVTEEDEDWQGVETAESCSQKTSLMFEALKKDSSLLLQTGETKRLMEYVKEILIKARAEKKAV